MCSCHCTVCSVKCVVYSVQYEILCKFTWMQWAEVQCACRVTLYSIWKYIVNCTWSPVNCNMCTAYCPLYTVHCKLYIVNHALHYVHCTLSPVNCKLCSEYCSLYMVQCTVYSVQCKLCSEYCALYTVHCLVLPCSLMCSSPGSGARQAGGCLVLSTAKTCCSVKTWNMVPSPH